MSILSRAQSRIACFRASSSISISLRCAFDLASSSSCFIRSLRSLALRSRSSRALCSSCCFADSASSATTRARIWASSALVMTMALESRSLRRTRRRPDGRRRGHV
eukprot:scaffold1307_cov200-Pinguiococcus_pyrenoidosus.AAC.68